MNNRLTQVTHRLMGNKTNVPDTLLSFTYRGSTGERLDKFLVSQLPDYTRSRLQNLIRDGFVEVNGKAITKTGATVEAGQQVNLRVPPPEPTQLIPEQIPLDVVFENQDLMVINKPAGMVVHPAIGHWTGTLVHAALAHAPEMEGINGEQRPGVVHRLDKETSGLIVLAKNDAAHHWLQNQFRLRKVQKIYMALVDGVPPTPVGRIDAPIGRDPSHRKRMAIVPAEKGRDAITDYQTVESFDRHTLIEAHPLTGRTHQIRLHMAFLQCPIVGDTLYGHRKPSLPIDRHFLHAYRLTIEIPGEKLARTFEAPLPPELIAILASLR
jgi:23S rRNA pseudouridine1911/1915/1917 synthase